MKIALCIRGHLRDGLNNDRLLKYIQLLQKDYEVHLFLHTWIESEAKSSYRQLDYKNIFTVEENHLIDYFSSCNVKKIIIDDDQQIKLYGNLEGTIGGGKCPVIAWKRMWAGKYALISYLYHNYYYDYDKIINTRYDKFTTQVCHTPIKNLLKITAENCKLSLKYPKYYRLQKGVDNYYVGTLETIHSLTHDFHYNLDSILSQYSIKGYHEEIFYKYAVDHGLV